MAYNFGSMTFATAATTSGTESPVVVVWDRMEAMVVTKLIDAQRAPGAADWRFDGK
jgi:hypothetical protein